MLTILGEYLVEIGRIMCRLKWVAILTFAMFSCGSTLLNSQTLSLDDAIKAAEVNNRSRYSISAARWPSLGSALLCANWRANRSDRSHSLYYPRALFHFCARSENHPLGGIYGSTKLACGGGCPLSRDVGCGSVRIVNQKEYSCCYFALREGLDARDGHRTVRSARSFRGS